VRAFDEPNCGLARRAENVNTAAVDPVIATGFFVFGLAFGSFLNVCIYRMPLRILVRDDLETLLAQAEIDASLELKQEIATLRSRERTLSIAAGRSACPRCGRPIAWYDNIPLVSWLILFGRCRGCDEPISSRYVVVELLTGVLFLGCYEQFGLTLAAAKYCALSFLLLGLIFTDAEHKLLPDALTVPGLALGLVFSYFVPVRDLFVGTLLYMLPMAGDRFARAATTAHSGWTSVGQSLIGALVGAGFIFGAGAMYRVMRQREGMGFGDVKLMAMIGSFLGVALTMFTIFTASFVGSAFGLATMLVVWMRRAKRRVRRTGESAQSARRRAWRSATALYGHFLIPFGVFLGSMALIAAFWGDALLRWWWLQFF
jgi:leader peptidase (prepilin peptidase) / N-methyltransferase